MLLMSKLILSVLLLSIIAVTTIGITNLQSIRAETNRECVAEDGGECKFVVKKMNGDFELTQKFNLGGGSGETVDQEARDDIVALEGNLSDALGQVAGLQLTVDSQGATINSQASQIDSLNVQVANLTTQLANAITDIQLNNGSVIVEPPPGPIDNQTGNQTGPINGNITEPNGNTTTPDGNATNGNGNGFEPEPEVEPTSLFELGLSAIRFS